MIHSQSNGDLWFTDIQGPDMKLSLRVKDVIHREESDYQSILLLDTFEMGRTLVLDGAIQTTDRDEHFYHEALVHPAIMLLPEKDHRDVAIIGGGDGGAAREVLKYPSTGNLDLVEIDERVVDLTREYFPQFWIGSDGLPIHEDPRFHLHITDGLQWVQDFADQGQTLDLIIADVSDPSGPSLNIFGEKFFRSISRILRPDGVFVLQVESPLGVAAMHHSIMSAIHRVFPDTRRYLASVPTYPGSIWAFGMVSSSDPSLSSETDFRRIEERFQRSLEKGVSYKIYSPSWHRAAFSISL